MQFLDIDENEKINLYISYEAAFRNGALPFENVFCNDIVVNLGYPNKYTNCARKSAFYSDFFETMVPRSESIFISERYLYREQLSLACKLPAVALDERVVDAVSDKFDACPHDASIFPIGGQWAMAIDHLVGFVWLGLSHPDFVALNSRGVLDEAMIENDLDDVKNVLPGQLAKLVVDYGNAGGNVSAHV